MSRVRPGSDLVVIRWRRPGHHPKAGQGWSDGLLEFVRVLGYRRAWRISDIFGDGRVVAAGDGWWEAEFEVRP